MEIINNFSGNHLNAIDDIIKDSETLYLVSPFMSESPYFYDVFFKKLSTNKIREIILITTLDDYSPDLLKKSNALYWLRLECYKAKIKCTIRIDNKLHGKIYIGVSKTTCKGIITSANFTESGLKNKNEWGVMIENKDTFREIIEELESNSMELNEQTLNEIIKKIDDYKKQMKITPKEKIDLRISDHLKKNQLMKITTSSPKRYFLKPVGYSEQPFAESRILNLSVEKLHFAKRPAAVSVGDVLICYGVGTTKLLGYFEVISDVINLEDGSRWEWQVEGKNLYPKYSLNWNKFNLTLSNLQLNYPEKILTYKGGDTLGSLQFGSDKVRLNENFAKYLINEMESQI